MSALFCFLTSDTVWPVTPSSRYPDFPATMDCVLKLSKTNLPSIRLPRVTTLVWAFPSILRQKCHCEGHTVCQMVAPLQKGLITVNRAGFHVYHLCGLCEGSLVSQLSFAIRKISLTILVLKSALWCCRKDEEE